MCNTPEWLLSQAYAIILCSSLACVQGVNAVFLPMTAGVIKQHLHKMHVPCKEWQNVRQAGQHSFSHPSPFFGNASEAIKTAAPWIKVVDDPCLMMLSLSDHSMR